MQLFTFLQKDKLRFSQKYFLKSYPLSSCTVKASHSHHSTRALYKAKQQTLMHTERKRYFDSKSNISAVGRRT